MSAMTRLERAWAFGRHIPPAQLVRRLSLSLRRALRDRLGPRGARTNATPPFSATPPIPLFQARRGMLATRDGGLTFTFIGRRHEMGTTIDWNAPDRSPALQLWRMNLHYMEYLEEIDDALFERLVGEWIRANPPDARGCWRDSWNSYALSLRVVVWMQQIALRGSRLSQSLMSSMAESLYAQLRFLEANLETDIGGNHLVKNIKALLWAGAFFDGAEGARWRKRGAHWLDRALNEQILADGVHFERSPSYHCQVFADLLECAAALPAGDGLRQRLDETLGRMAIATADLAHPDGRVAQFNDAGLSMAYAPHECLDVFQRLLGKGASPRKVFTFRDAGYFGLRDGDAYFIADCGRVAPDELPAHGHGDILAFEWSVGGERVIVDQGVYEYIAGERRRVSRAAASHNTLCFEGADQADFFGAFRCGRRPDVAIRALESGPDWLTLEGTHDGFAHLPGAPRHVRRFQVHADRIEILDRIEGRPDRPARARFLFHPLTRIEKAGDILRIARAGKVIRMQSSQPIQVEKAVWWPDMGIEQETKSAFIAIDPGVAEVVTSFSIEPGV